MLGKGAKIGIAVAVLVVIVAGASSCGKKEVIDAPLANSDKGNTVDDNEDDANQKRLVKRYGEAPDGFKWDDNGDLIALGDTSLTAEEVAYTYLKSASLLDFEMLQKVSSKSTVVNKYKGFSEDFDYSSDFRKKMYKESLKSIKINKLVDTAVYAENKSTFTFSINILDLTNKDFWKKDSEEIFNTIYTYRKAEDDSTKAKNYIYDYILSIYSSDSAPRHDVEVEITVSKNKSGAWLVSDDNSLNAICLYSDGELVNDAIYSEYDDWYDRKMNGK